MTRGGNRSAGLKH